jgi:hypothetical protein
MPLYEVTSARIAALHETTFAQAGLRERTDLQRLLREQVEIISPDTLVVAEEFGDWEDSRRRIDLLGVDRNANLVVIELKRTEDGGHMELQALRYAAMISTMTFDQVVETFSLYLRRQGRDADPRATLLEFLDWVEPEEERFGKEVRIVLASAAFARELTTAVMWLNDHGLDIRCVRLQPYQDGERIFLDVQQLIPLPEAADYQIRVKAKVQAERVARQVAGGRDLTKFTITTPHGTSSPLPKRRAMLEAVRGLVANSVPIGDIQRILQSQHSYGPAVIRSADDDLDREAFLAALADDLQAGGRKFNLRRYFCADDELIHVDGRSYALTNQWGEGTLEAIQSLMAAFPNASLSYSTVEVDA